MQQYEFRATSHRDGSRAYVRATAGHVRIARWHVLNYYGDAYAISAEPVAIRPAHHVLGEIDCTSAGCESIVPREFA